MFFSIDSLALTAEAFWRALGHELDRFMASS
jgi:hypothetical protein